MFIRNAAIIKVEIFHEELPVLKRENCFRFLFAVCNFMLSIRLNFVSQSVLYSGTSVRYLSDRHQIYLMTCGAMVFREVDRSVNQIEFHQKS